MKNKFYPELDSIRGLMAWWVVFGHIYSYLHNVITPIPLILQKFLLATAVPVSIFICLSGFVIASSILNSEKNGFSYSGYLLGRAFRVFPVYLVLLIISIIFMDARYIARTEASWLSMSQVNLYSEYFLGIINNFWIYLFVCLTLFQGVVPDQLLNHAGDAFLSPIWSLSLEWQFYALAPLIVIGMLKRKLLLYGLIFLYIVFNIFIKFFDITFSYGAFFPQKIPFFLIGILSFYCQVKIINGKSTRIIFFQLFFLVFSLFIAGEKFSSILAAIFWVIALFFVCSSSKFEFSDYFIKKVRYFLNLEFLKKIGRTSYPTYLLHILIIDLLGYIYFMLGIKINNLNLLIFFASVLFILFYASIVVNKLIERPAVNFGKKIILLYLNKNAKN